MTTVTKEIMNLARKLGYTGKAPDTVAKAINAITASVGEGGGEGGEGGSDIITLVIEEYDSAKHDALIGQTMLEYVFDGDYTIHWVYTGATAKEVFDNLSKVQIQRIVGSAEDHIIMLPTHAYNELFEPDPQHHIYSMYINNTPNNFFNEAFDDDYCFVAITNGK